MKQETLRPPAASMRSQQSRFDAFRVELNEERPHEGIANRVPLDLYRPAAREFPSRLTRIEYPPEFEVRQVAATGRIRWKGAMVMINRALEGESIGIHLGDGMHNVFFSGVRLSDSR